MLKKRPTLNGELRKIELMEIRNSQIKEEQVDETFKNLFKKLKKSEEKRIKGFIGFGK